MAHSYGYSVMSGAMNNPNLYGITTYGALILPYKDEPLADENKNKVKSSNSLKGKLKTAWNNASTYVKNNIKNPTQMFRDLSDYIEVHGDEIAQNISQAGTFIGDKLSGVALVQTIMDGQVTTQEALDYLFLGFAPALGVTGSALGYSGLEQMKDALTNGTINVGQFINGFTDVLKGGGQLKDLVSRKQTKKRGDVIQFDLTISHNESYQSESPDRRVQNGQSLQEYIHNLPETFTVECALQEGKRYSKQEFRSIMTVLRNRKEFVTLVLGDEMFEDLMLTDFSPNSDCSTSNFNYTLSFKKCYRADIDTDREVTIQKIPIEKIQSDLQSEIGSIGSGTNIGSLGKGVGNLEVDMAKINKELEAETNKAVETLSHTPAQNLLNNLTNGDTLLYKAGQKILNY